MTTTVIVTSCCAGQHVPDGLRVLRLAKQTLRRCHWLLHSLLQETSTLHAMQTTGLRQILDLAIIRMNG